MSKTLYLVSTNMTSSLSIGVIDVMSLSSGVLSMADDFALIMKWIMKKAKLDNEVTPMDNDDMSYL